MVYRTIRPESIKQASAYQLLRGRPLPPQSDHRPVIYVHVSLVFITITQAMKMVQHLTDLTVEPRGIVNRRMCHSVTDTQYGLSWVWNQAPRLRFLPR